MPPILNIITTAVIYVHLKSFNRKMASHAHHAKNIIHKKCSKIPKNDINIFHLFNGKLGISSHVTNLRFPRSSLKSCYFFLGFLRIPTLKIQFRSLCDIYPVVFNDNKYNG